MQWKGRRQSDNVEDRRGSGGSFGGGGGFRIPIGGGGRGGGLSIGGIVLILGICWLTGINPLTLLAGGDIMGEGGGYEQSGQAQPPANDEMGAFVRTVLADTEDTWTGIFERVGQRYQAPKLVMFSGQTRSACGAASSSTGPFYCPGDRQVYVDTDFFRELDRRFGASGDFAEAYVVAHEVGHHVQNLLGILPKFNQARQGMSEAEANRMSVRVELQADCFAGLWGKHTQQKGFLERGDLEEALNAARQIGDDTLQKRSQGYVVPESFNHGTSEQRMTWFRRGFESGDINSCDTFSGAI